MRSERFDAAGIELRTVREAGELSRWLPLIEAAAAAESARAGSLLSANPAAFYAGFCGAGGATVLALCDGRLVGFGLLGLGARVNGVYDGLIAERGLDRARCGSVMGAWVDAGLRGRGIAGRLAAERLAVARRVGVSDVFGSVHPDNVASRRTFERHGARFYGPYRVYSTRVLRWLFHVELGGGSGEDAHEAVDRHDGGGAE